MDKKIKNDNDLIKSDLKENKQSNLVKIKSNHILAEIFSFINVKTQLSILTYNNYLKKKLAINIENYKKISGKYKKGGKNGICKLYDLETNNLIFEGEYLNGKKNGKGKEYHINDKLKFEGEYLNGKRNGKGKEYYVNDQLKLEGEYLKIYGI